jgi:hypothetical protein
MVCMNGSTNKHTNLSHQYGCRAYMTTATFVAYGIFHVARRFFRADMPGTGKIELYTVEPYPGAHATALTELAWYDSTTTEDWLGYAVDGTRVASLAAAALDAVGSTTASDQEARFGLIELS